MHWKLQATRLSVLRHPQFFDPLHRCIFGQQLCLSYSYTALQRDIKIYGWLQVSVHLVLIACTTCRIRPEKNEENVKSAF